MTQKDLFQTTTSSHVDTHVNHSVSLDLEKEKKTTDTSGRSCLKLLHAKDPLGSFAKTFMVTLPWVSTKCCLTWKVKATPQGRLLFQLVPKMHTIGEIDSGSSAKMWATPRVGGEESFESVEKRLGTQKAKKHNLFAQVQHDMKLWPTPNAWDGNRGPRSKENLIEKSHQINLISAVKDAQDPDPVHMWPTPTANQSGEGEFLNTLRTKEGNEPTQGQRAYNPETGKHVQVTLNRAVKMWPTPRARDYKDGPSIPPSVMEGRRSHNLGTKVVESTQTKASGSLNPTWVEWLMGYPKGWTDLKD